MATGLSRPRVPWADPVIAAEERRAVLRVLDDGRLTQGPRVERFERSMAAHLGARHAVAVGSGTAALELLLAGLGLRPGDEVIVPSMTYFATAAAVSRVGAVPVFVDVDPVTFNLDPGRVGPAVTPATRAILYVDSGGVPAAHDELAALARRHGLLLVQDAAQSLGATRAGRPVGADAPWSVMSFHMAKLVTTIEGGMIFTGDADLAGRLRSLRSQGETEKGVHGAIGTNCRMTEVQAAVGLCQLAKVAVLQDGRRELVGYYAGRLADVAGVSVLDPAVPGTVNGHFMFRILVRDRSDVCRALDDAGVEYRIAYPRPVYRQPAYAAGTVPHRVTDSPVSEWFARHVLALPMSSRMSAADRRLVCDTVAAGARGGGRPAYGRADPGG